MDHKTYNGSKEYSNWLAATAHFNESLKGQWIEPIGEKITRGYIMFQNGNNDVSKD